jgi:hypothetical protein
MLSRVQDNQIILTEDAIVPATPDSGAALIYPTTGDVYHQIDDAGTDRTLIFDFDVEDKQSGTVVGTVLDIQGTQDFVSVPTTGEILMYLHPIPTERVWFQLNVSQPFGSNILQYGNVGSITGTKTSIENYSDGEAVRITSGTSNTTPYGVTNSVQPRQRCQFIDSGCELLVYAKVRTFSAIANLCIQVGMMSDSAASDDIGAVQGVYFRYSTSASDPGWVGVVHASSANRNVSGNLGNVATSTTYELLMWLSSDGVRFSVDGAAPTLVAYPTGFGSVGMGGVCSVTPRDGVAKVFEVFNFYSESEG